MEPGVQFRIQIGSPITLILSRMIPIPHILLILWRDILIFSSHPRLSLYKGLPPAGLPVKNLKELQPSSILAIWPAHLNHLELITLAILHERYQL